MISVKNLKEILAEVRAEAQRFRDADVAVAEAINCKPVDRLKLERAMYLRSMAFHRYMGIRSTVRLIGKAADVVATRNTWDDELGTERDISESVVVLRKGLTEYPEALQA